MTNGPKQVFEANATPRKSFFVDMLTRDIDLQDALLDLLDNCVDGILRNAEPDLTKPRPYEGYRASIVINQNKFLISDNCGGIPLDLAVNSAFAIGKPEPIEGADAVATVGMYGIGMKRAIFKLGTDATVRSWSDVPFEVRITPAWIADDGWEPLPLTQLVDGSIAERGTTLAINALNAAVAREFSRKTFIGELERVIARQYALIIDKGFEVAITDSEEAIEHKNLTPIHAERFQLLQAAARQDGALAPYIYAGEIDGVEVEIYAGLWRELPSEEEREREEETRGRTDSAGWTVACNDRIVIWKDRTRLTGWGEASTPNYHGQFIAITGIVLLKSQDPTRLPLTTTKRGIDAGSDLYSKCKDLMREATKQLASFTNKWKNYASEREALYRESSYLDLPALQQETKRLREAQTLRAVHNMPGMTKRAPNLPVPVQAKSHVRIGFNAEKSSVADLAKAYFEDPGAKPAAVGERAFQLELARIRAQ